MKPLYVQYGCGWCAPEGWLNFDASPTLRFERLPMLGGLYTRNAERFPAAVRYGDIVRYRPPFTATTALLWAGPFLLLLAGLVWAWRYLRARPAAATPRKVSEAEVQKLLEETRKSLAAQDEPKP